MINGKSIIFEIDSQSWKLYKKINYNNVHTFGIPVDVKWSKVYGIISMINGTKMLVIDIRQMIKTARTSVWDGYSFVWISSTFAQRELLKLMQKYKICVGPTDREIDLIYDSILTWLIMYPKNIFFYKYYYVHIFANILTLFYLKSIH